MSVSYDILRTSAVTADVAVPQLDQANLTEVSRNLDNKGVAIVTYTIASGDPTRPTTVVSRVDPTGRQNRCTLAINSFAHSADSVTGVEVFSPVSVILTINLPKDVMVEAADLAALIGNLYGLTFTTLTSKIPDAVVVNNFRFGKVDHF